MDFGEILALVTPLSVIISVAAGLLVGRLFLRSVLRPAEKRAITYSRFIVGLAFFIALFFEGLWFEQQPPEHYIGIGLLWVIYVAALHLGQKRIP